uniref:RING-type E3 ubiquitin transferase n=1 Tax=Parastrongyloides trichosuri TaxID=131310 RepID=A0A0N4ZT94_PARTI
MFTQVESLRNRHVNSVTQPISNFFTSFTGAAESLTTQYNNITQGVVNSEDNFSTSPLEFQIPLIMPFRDRTAEFRTTGKSYQMKIRSTIPQSTVEDRRHMVQESIAFNQLSKKIGRDLGLTCTKMEKLTELAKRKSLFDDKINEIEQLSRIIKQDITGLNKQIAQLQEYAKRRASSRYQSQDHSKLVVVGLQSKLANVSKDFQTVLEVRTENMKQLRNRREMFSQVTPLSTNPMLPSSSNKNLLTMDNEHNNSNTVSLDMDALEQHRIQDQMTLLDETGNYLQARNNAMETIESNISELGQIFRQLASLVAEQGEMITRIDSNVEHTSLNIDSAHHELVKYFNNIAKNRWLIIKVFGTLMAFFIFVNLLSEHLKMVLQVSLPMIVGYSSLFTLVTIAHAFAKKEQFYPAMIYLTTNNFSICVLYAQVAVFVYLIYEMIKKILFGTLRVEEIDHVYEHCWHAVMETCLAFTVFRDDFSAKHVMFFVLLLLVKSFHWLCENRVDYMERSPIISTTFHIRIITTLALLALFDSYFCSDSFFNVIANGSSVHLIFGFEYAIMLVSNIHIFIKYLIHNHDARLTSPWANKSVYLLYAELFINTINVIIYSIFTFIMFKVHAVPLFALRPFYSALRACQKSFNDVIQSRRAIHAMNNLFHFATEEELSQMDAVCIICRDEMIITDRPKKLPCGHIFHTNCLRTWFQFQRTCPTCRADVLHMTPPTPNNNQNNNQNPNENQNPPFENRPVINVNVPQNDRIRVAVRLTQIQQNNQQTTPIITTQNNEGNGNQQHIINTLPNVSFPISTNVPIFPMFSQAPPYPQMNPVSFPDPPEYSGLTDEELREMEDKTRDSVIARINALRNIQTLLEAATLQFDQYRNIQLVQEQMKERADKLAEEAKKAQERQIQQNVQTESSINNETDVQANNESEVQINNEHEVQENNHEQDISNENEVTEFIDEEDNIEKNSNSENTLEKNTGVENNVENIEDKESTHNNVEKKDDVE